MCGFLEIIIGQHIAGEDDRNFGVSAGGGRRRSAREDDDSRGTDRRHHGQIVVVTQKGKNARCNDPIRRRRLGD
jgi:hypothetical protein